MLQGIQRRQVNCVSERDGVLLPEGVCGQERPPEEQDCLLVAAWAAHSQHTARVQGALLVAPPDTERQDMPPQLHNWRPMVRERLPFAATVLFSSDDPYAAPERALALAEAWGASAHGLGVAGHINGDSGLGDWPEGLARLQALGWRGP